MAPSWTDQNGNPVYIDGLDALGAPMIKSPFNLESAQTVGAQKLWPGGGSGFNIAGSNVLIAQWDVGDVLTNHQEFWLGGFRVRLLDGPTTNGPVDHATHVAGTLVAWGGYAPAEGFANRGHLIEAYDYWDFSEMPAVAATNSVRVSNHS